MKNLVIRKYLVRIFIYTAVYAAVVLIMDLIFNGTVIDYLYDRLPPKLFFLIWQNKSVTALIVYIVGLVVVSVIHVFRLAKLLQTASAAVTQETLLSDTQNCPDELKDFSLRLIEFRQMLHANEAARKAAEQQKKRSDRISGTRSQDPVDLGHRLFEFVGGISRVECRAVRQIYRYRAGKSTPSGDADQ